MCSSDLAPFIVFDDADLDAAVEGAMISKYRNNGQTCVCANRILVQDKVYDAFAAKLAEKVNAMKVGNGRDPGVVIGPLINSDALAKVEEHINDALTKGARVIAGGKRHTLGGFFFEPTVLVDPGDDARVVKEEIFGPVLTVMRWEDTEDLIRRANDSIYGLAAGIWTNDLRQAHLLAGALRAGTVWINCYNLKIGRAHV